MSKVLRHLPKWVETKVSELFVPTLQQRKVRNFDCVAALTHGEQPMRIGESVLVLYQYRRAKAPSSNLWGLPSTLKVKADGDKSLLDLSPKRTQGVVVRSHTKGCPVCGKQDL